jgi:SPP1 family predicted phage head-tail adaptor
MKLKNIGALRHRLTVEEPVESDDGAGGVTRSYSDGATLWGVIYPFKKLDDKRQDRLTQYHTHKILIRYCETLTLQHRLRHHGRIYHIRAVVSQGMKDCFTEILAEEETP